MLINKRRRLVGFLLAIATPAVLGAIAFPAAGLNANDPQLDPTCGGVAHNLVANCGFETAPTSSAIPNWTHLVSHDGALSTASAHSGTHSLALGSFVSGFAAGDDDVFTQTIKVTPHTHYVVGAWINAANSSSSSLSDSNDFTLAATNVNGTSDATTIYSATNINHVVGWQQVGGEVTTTGATSITLIIRGANGPDHTYVDDVFVAAQLPGCAAIANNPVSNCGFEAGSGSPGAWVHSAGTNATIQSNSSYGGDWSLRFGATPPDSDSWFQVVAVRPHTQYTLSYWDENWSGTSPLANNLSVIVSNVPAASGGSLRITTTNAANNFWTHVTRTFTTGSGSTTVLLITGANQPGWTYVDDFSITAVPHVRLTHSGRATTTTLTGLGGQRVHLEKFVNKRWVVIHTWTAPKTGWSKSWAYTVGSGGTYRSVSDSAPGYSSAISAKVSIS